jgi:hypothetical protein
MIFFGSDPGSGSDFSESSGSDPGSGSYSGSGSCTNLYESAYLFIFLLVEKMWLFNRKVGYRSDPDPKWFIPDPDPAKSSGSTTLGGSVSISTKLKAKLYLFLEHFNILFKILKIMTTVTL